MRQVVYERIRDDVALRALGVTVNAVYTGDVDTPDERPFINLRWGIVNPGQGQVTRQFLTVWVHDRPDDYTRIDSVMTRLRTLIQVELPTSGNGASWIVCADWNGDSDDLVDTGHETITRNASFTIVGSGR